MVAVGVVFLMLGLLFLLAGWKVFRFIVWLYGFLIGCLVGILIGLAISIGGSSSTQIIWTVFFALAGGAFGAWLALLLMKVTVFLMGFGFGAGLASIFYGSDFFSNLIQGILYRQYHFDSGYIALLIILGLLFGILAVIFFRFFIVAWTSYFGSSLFCSGLIALGAVSFSAYLVLFFVLWFLGIFYQYAVLKLPSMEKIQTLGFATIGVSAFPQKICPYCNSQIPTSVAKFCTGCGASLVCPACGERIKKSGWFCERCGARIRDQSSV